MLAEQVPVHAWYRKEPLLSGRLAARAQAALVESLPAATTAVSWERWAETAQQEWSFVVCVV